MSPVELSAILVIGLNLLALPFLALLLVAAISAMTGSRRTALPAEPETRFLIVIPAHDEREGIARTVASCRAQDYPAGLFAVLVIADNCTDETAELAEAAGAEVLVRSTPDRRSKGYAIEHLIERLQESGRFDATDALVVIDADTFATPDLLRKFDAKIREGNDWAQCYDTVANPDASWRTRLMTYAFSLVNGVVPYGLERLGVPSPLNGNGMCLTTRGLRRVPWRAYGLVEDYEFSWIVRRAGEHVAFVPDAAVEATMLEKGGQAAATQRRRWEAGRKDVKRRLFGEVLRDPGMGLWERLIALVQLKTPPTMRLLALLALLTGLNLAALVALGDPLSGTIGRVLIAASAFSVASVAVYALSPFVAFGVPWRYLGVLAYVPAYGLWKLTIRAREKPAGWVRTAREPAAVEGAARRDVAAEAAD
jgi:1,2-diacylglycerol 3-beta-glucosyltransferase